jgi:hypothetical protein
MLRFLAIAATVNPPFAVPPHPTATMTSRISVDGSRPSLLAISSQQAIFRTEDSRRAPRKWSQFLLDRKG